MTYGKRNGAVHALRGVNMVMERGDLLAFTGKSGCGKSTLLNILGAVCTPTSGFYLFELKVQRFPRPPAPPSIGQTIACAPVANLLLADATTGALDEETGGKILQIFQQLNQRGMTILIVTHDEEVSAGCHRKIRMRDGLME